MDYTQYIAEAEHAAASEIAMREHRPMSWIRTPGGQNAHLGPGYDNRTYHAYNLPSEPKPMTAIVYGVPTPITPETILATREHFADITRTLIAEALAGTSSLASHVDIPAYVRREFGRIADELAGANDHTFTFIQRAVWIQTGNMPGMFAR